MFIWKKLHDIACIAIESEAYPANQLNGNRLVMTHFYHCACTDTCLFTQFLLLHSFINEELKQLIVGNSHGSFHLVPLGAYKLQ